MPQCRAIKRDGARCTASVGPGEEWCWNHDPIHAERRRKNAAKGGKSTGGREIKDLKKRISEVVEAVLDGSLDRGRAAVGIQGLNALRGVLELERKAKEVEELEERLVRLEEAAAERGGGRWRA